MKASPEEAHMEEAIALAGRALGITYPNPAVGAVIVKRGETVGRGFHARWGAPHAEAVALREAGVKARGADLYVTLEPCCHHGLTPPCTEAILKSGIRRVYVAVKDPNPQVCGRGIRVLRRAGVEVRLGLLRKEAAKLNEAYLKYMVESRPFVTLKIAQSLDGKIATGAGDSKWITSQASRRMVKDMRRKAQAVMVGIGTVVQDDPSLLPTPADRAFYLRCVLDTHLRTPAGSKIVRTAARHSTLIYFNQDKMKRRQVLEKYGVRCVPVGAGRAGSVDISGVLDHLGSLGVQSLIVEGGARVFTSFVREGHSDKLVVFMAPNIMGGEDSLSAFLDVGTNTVRGVEFEIDQLSRISTDIAASLYPARRRRRAARRPEGKTQRHRRLRASGGAN
jgi:diaminohydroxyphosphoribosylaminopyrimidine deaminase/5-amino-6-(5-phosphoribosylamino)uracil reductase